MTINEIKLTRSDRYSLVYSTILENHIARGVYARLLRKYQYRRGRCICCGQRKERKQKHCTIDYHLSYYNDTVEE